MALPLLDVPLLVTVLADHNVEYVLIGGLAATVHGSPLRTDDADLCPSRSAENLDRLAAALRQLQARIYAPDIEEGLAFACDAVALGDVQILNLVTLAGRVDLAMVPSGTQGYADLRRSAVRYRLAGADVWVADLVDVIRSKTAAGRDKDARSLPVLRELLAQRRALREEPSSWTERDGGN